MTTEKGYIGERHDPETGLIYLNARYMDPKFGRFISPDDWDPTKQWIGTGKIQCSPNLITDAGNHLAVNAAHFPTCSRLNYIVRSANSARKNQASHIYDLYKTNLGMRRDRNVSHLSVDDRLNIVSIPSVAATGRTFAGIDREVRRVGTNRYAYSANDPINKSDPNGHVEGGEDSNSEEGGNANAGKSSEEAMDNHFGRNSPMNGIDPTQPGYEAPMGEVNLDVNNNGRVTDEISVALGTASAATGIAAATTGNPALGVASAVAGIADYASTF